MRNDIELRNILFLDIETVPASPDFLSLDEDWQALWADKTRFLQEREQKSAEELYDRAGIYAEFGKVICISTAILTQEGGKEAMRVKSFYGDDEAELLGSFSNVLDRFFSGKEKYLCGHNVREFDAPFMARRMLIHGMSLPDLLNTPGKKPWEVKHLDTLDLWKFGDYKHFTSLRLLTKLFGIPSPKDDISGADVWRVYWQENDLERIKTYCEKDTIAVCNLYRRMNNLALIRDEDIEVV